jgi:Ca-activated chloride channel family protein
LLLVFQWRIKSRPIPVPFDHQPHGRRRFLGFLLDSATVIPTFILAAVVILLAGPRRFEQPRNEREMTNIQFCLDVSGSMMANFGSGTRYDGAMSALNDFLTYRKGDSFGLLVFGDSNLQWVPLTTDVSAFACAPPFLRPSNLPRWFRGGTFIGKALRESEKLLLAADEGDRMIVLFSDGDSFDLRDGKDIKIAQSLKDNNITLYGIHVAEGAPSEPVALIASMTGGAVFSAGDPAALETVFKRIDEMQQAPIKRLTPDPVDFFQPFALAGLSLAALWLLTLFGFRYTPW